MSKELLIRTIQMGKHSWVNDLIDITVKSGDITFAPTWNMVLSYKNGAMSQEGYTRLYADMMTRSLLKSPDRWDAIIDKGSITLACYCTTGAFCHRHLLAEYLRQYAESKGYNIIMGGEVIRDPRLLK